MRKEAFLDKLQRKGILSLAEPSKEIAKAYLKKSESNLISSKILLENERFEKAISLAYYSMYHMAQALLHNIGIKCENHTATIILIKRIFGIDSKELEDAKKDRVNTQYYVDLSIVNEDASELICRAERFNSTIMDFMARLKRQDIETLRKRAEHMLGG
ncbi:HEPN domain protein [archaeon BMS3Abin16]|nr:HEPN domain protein [archaeon BMS3Abin16]